MRVAIIDVGSNAIRAAVYDGCHLGAAEIFNEKFKSDLSALLEYDKIDVRHGTYNIFSYFCGIFKLLDVQKIECVATEVLRNHPKAELFINEIYERFNIKIQVLSGEDEARITAEGLISSIPDAKGIAADLGGGSLEFAEVHDKSVHFVKSLPLGTKVLSRMQLESEDEIIEKIKKEVSSDDLENLYLIGGSLRLLGRCFMDYNKSIIKNLHNQVIEPNLFLEFLDQLENLQKFQRFFAQYKVNKYAIIVSKALIKYFKPKNLVISTFGLKEGVRFNFLSKEEQRKDIVFERCLDFTKTFASEISVESYKNLFMNLGFDPTEKQIKLFSIALILSQYTRHIDKNHKADWIVSFILTTDIPFDQKQRAALIVAIANSLSSKANIIPKSLRKLLSREEYSFSRIIGSLLKIAVIIDGPLLSKPSFGIKTKGNFLEISTQHVLPKIVFDKVCEQLKNISFMKRQLNSTR